MSGIGREVRSRLFELQDLKYRDFQCRLLPTVDPGSVIGVRTPELRRYARALAGKPEAAEFLEHLPHKYFEENNLHGFLIGEMKDYGAAVDALDVFLPYVNNWATCDQIRPKVFGKHLPELRDRIRKWISESHVYTVRFGIEMLMAFYLDGQFMPEYPEWVAGVRSGEYYVNMMIAWYFATALAKQYDAVLPYIRGFRLDPWTHNKTIQKAVESFRITEGQKAYLRSLKVKLRGKSFSAPLSFGT